MKKIISYLLIAVLTVSVMGMSVSASSFADLNDSQWDWARDAIDEMTAQGLIAGYSASEFGPADGVTTLQAMLFMSRIIGFYEEVNADVLEKANELYGEFLAPYQLSNQSEIALLMYYDVFSKSELQSYLATSKINKVLKRHEAAIFLTKAAGAEKELDSTSLSFEDSNEIPNDSKKYVSYVVKQGYMVGVSDKEFGPNQEVNRAQIATMLYRIINDLNITYVKGEIVKVSDSSVSVKTSGAAKSYSIPAGAQVRINGAKKALSSAKAGDSILLKYLNGTITYVDVIFLEADRTIEGYISSKNSGSVNEIKVITADAPDGETYSLDEKCKIVYDGKTVKFDDITLGDNVELSFKEEKLCQVLIKTRTDKVTSVEFVGIVYEPELGIVTKTNAGVERTYLVDEKVTVKRNSRGSELKDLLVGDNLSLTLNNNKVTAVAASSTKGSNSGTIEAINISATPSVTIGNGKTSTEYSLSNSTEITVDGEKGDIYDLRLGYAVDISLESDTVTKLTTKVVQTKNTLMGTVDSVNSNYGFLYIYATDTTGTGETKRIQVFTKKGSGTQIIDNKNNNGSRELKKILSGESVLVTGIYQADGTFEAATIIILAD